MYQSKSILQFKSSQKSIKKALSANKRLNWRDKIYSGKSDLKIGMPFMFLPGKIVYLEKRRDFDNHYRKLMPDVKWNKQTDKFIYVPRWAQADEFQEIIISRSMISDHSPFKLLDRLKECKQECFTFI
jgi:hypothetical protein